MERERERVTRKKTQNITRIDASHAILLARQDIERKKTLIKQKNLAVKRKALEDRVKVVKIQLDCNTQTAIENIMEKRQTANLGVPGML